MNALADRGHLLRLLGVSFGIAVAVGEMIGPGILRTPSLVAAGVPVAALILCLWAFGALHALLQANVLAELGTMLPRAGGQYVFVHRAFGDAGGLIVGWTMWCAHIVGLAASAIAFAEFLAAIWPSTASHTPVVAAGLVLVLFAANVVGLREGRALQVITSIAKAALLILFVCAALWFLPEHPAPAPSQISPSGFLAVAGAYQLIRGAYNGWHAPVYFAEENVLPARSIPRSLFVGVMFTGTLYVVINATLLRSLGAAAMASGPLPYLAVLGRIAGGWTPALFAIGAMITAASCANANVMIAPRVLFALSRDRLLPAALQSVNRGGSPHYAFALSATVALVLSASGGFRFVFGMIGTLVTLASLITEIAFFVLRAREPDLERPWRAVIYPWLPAAVVATDATLLVLFVLADVRGAIVASMLCALSLPIAVVARSMRARTNT
ncbi:MAG: APC family permease [Rhizomicrobium sp.]|jgi:APA family basic amino acid/polyamine antiporter